MIGSMAMHALKARVQNGHIVLDEPTDLPEGTELYLVPEMDDAERAALEQALEEGERDIEAGRVHGLADVLTELRKTP